MSDARWSDAVDRTEIEAIDKVQWNSSHNSHGVVRRQSMRTSIMSFISEDCLQNVTSRVDTPSWLRTDKRVHSLSRTLLPKGFSSWLKSFGSSVLRCATNPLREKSPRLRRIEGCSSWIGLFLFSSDGIELRETCNISKNCDKKGGGTCVLFIDHSNLPKSQSHVTELRREFISQNFTCCNFEGIVAVCK